MSNAADNTLYEARVAIYPRSVKGRFRNLKWAILILAYGVYFLLPWLPWTRAVGPAQAVSFDIEGRRFYLFDLVVHAQDIFLLAGVLVTAAVLLFFVTGMLGRVFCGYFCFQTLWTDVYILIERLVQGERPARIRLARAPWGPEKLAKLGLTHLLWLAMAFWTGLTFTLYWGYAPRLLVDILTGTAPFPAYATTAFLTATTYVMAGLAREQVCTYMCPYARFQGVMFDRDTRIVAYDEARGEGAGGRRKVAKGLKTRAERRDKGVGDCIDCGYCVQVCPTGIDIRNGLQYQCISCALCIDACDSIMDTLGWPRGLIRYTSENQLQGRPSRLLKAKNVGYALVLVAVVAFLTVNILNVAPLELAVRQVRQPLFVTLSDGRIQNSYELKINNKTADALALRVEITGLPGAALDLGRLETLEVRADHSLRVMARVRAAPEPGAGSREFRFRLLPREGAGPAPVSAPALFHQPRAGR